MCNIVNDLSVTYTPPKNFNMKGWVRLGSVMVESEYIVIDERKKKEKTFFLNIFRICEGRQLIYLKLDIILTLAGKVMLLFS